MKQHIVKKGDTLWGLSQKYYGDGRYYHRLQERNIIVDPNKIEVGEVLEIPFPTGAIEVTLVLAYFKETKTKRFKKRGLLSNAYIGLMRHFYDWVIVNEEMMG